MIPLAKAAAWAERVRAELDPFCEHGCCVVAGSVRRCRPQIGDLDILCIPTDRVGLERRISESCTVTECGPQIIRAQLRNGVQLDVYIARPPERDLLEIKPGNWGIRLLTSTGSKDFNIWLARRALELGYAFSPFAGLFRASHCVAWETEEDIFRHLNLPFIAPEAREVKE